jgi:LPXTG-motif cell wall-anchored protein
MEPSVLGIQAKGGAIMKTGIIIALAVAGIAGIFIAVRYLQDTGNAVYQPERVFTTEESNFARQAHQMLETAILMDEEAARRAHLKSVRDFAGKTASDHRNMQEELASAVRRVDPDFAFDGQWRNPALEHQDGPGYDRDYLEDFITRHEQMRNTIEETASVRENPSLIRFISLWKANTNGHASEARHLLMELPDTASNMTLLLLAGMASLAAAALMRAYRTVV